MALPKLSQPLFELEIPSTGKKVNFRPFTVKEEKLLLIAKESNDADQAVLAIKQIINNCFNDVNVDSLATFDLEYMLIQLRSKSVSNAVEFTIKDPETEEEIEISLDTDDITIIKNEDHTDLIQLQDNIYLQMQYPHIDQMKEMANATEETQNQILFNVMMSCIYSVIEGDEVSILKDYTEKEVTDFVESLSSENVKDIKNFFDTMPKLRYETTYTRQDGTEKKFIAEGTETFFI